MKRHFSWILSILLLLSFGLFAVAMDPDSDETPVGMSGTMEFASTGGVLDLTAAACCGGGPPPCRSSGPKGPLTSQLYRQTQLR